MKSDRSLAVASFALSVLVGSALTGGILGGCDDASQGMTSGLDSGLPPPPAADVGTPAVDTGRSPPISRSALTCEEGKSCPPCVDGKTGCAAGGTPITGTCCALGDAVEVLSEGRASEVVDLEVDGKYVILCGGFGADISDISDPRAPVYVGSATKRCQRIALGGKTRTGGRIFYLAHHGDSWVPTPFLATYQIEAGKGLEKVHEIADPKVLFEGLAFHEGMLYVAAHEGGVRVYQTSAKNGTPAFVGAVTTGINNAWKLVVGDGVAYVADASGSIVVLDLSDPKAPKVLRQVATTGGPRDIVFDAAEKRIYVALGGAGVDIFDATNAREPKLLRSLTTRGSAQAVAASKGVLAIAAWNHVALHDTKSFALLAIQRTRKAFEQNFGVAKIDDTLYVGEWEGLHVLRYHAGRVAPRLWIDEDLFALEPDRPSAAVVVRNIGTLELNIEQVTVDDGAYVVTKTSLKIPAGGVDSFEIQRPAPAPNGETKLRIVSDDPDPGQSSLELTVIVERGNSLDVGDKIDSDFGFLDPSGAGQLSGLEGKVIVLAYFALF